MGSQASWELSLWLRGRFNHALETIACAMEDRIGTNDQFMNERVSKQQTDVHRGCSYTPLAHPESAQPSIITCIIISVQTHLETQTLIRCLSFIFAFYRILDAEFDVLSAGIGV